MADPKKEETKIEVQKHENIFEALSAFQGDNPEITRSSKVEFNTKEGKVSFMYAPLDEVLKTVRPLLAKHGLSVTFGGNAKGELICSLYHSTYKVKRDEAVESEKISYAEDGETYSGRDKVYGLIEEGVIRSLPIKVKREGAMKDIGSDSTYARRYMLAEVLGISSDEDKDAELEEKSQKNVETFAFRKLEEGLKTAKKEAELVKQIDFIKKEIATIKEGKKAPDLGMKLEQYERLLAIGEGCLAKLKGKEDIKVENEDDGSVPPDEVPNLEDVK